MQLRQNTLQTLSGPQLVPKEPQEAAIKMDVYF